MDSNDPVDRQSALQKINGPAIGLIVTGGLGILGGLLSLVQNLFTAGSAPFAPGDDQFAWLFSGVVGVSFAILGIAVSGFVIWGALQTQRLASYPIALSAAIVAMVPCLSPCCIVGIPAGIWALVVMHNPAVRPAFTR